ncbi:unnamed protein product [Rotaria sp. Silwood1]|nr:unnamed protein product [Rotaria sp. Silwood1]
MHAPVYHHNSSHHLQSSMLSNSELSIRRRPTHNPSKNLSTNEIQCLYDLLGKNCVTLATTVAQILHADNNNWKKQACGVLCFIKDYNKRNYYFRLYDLQLKQIIYEETISSSLRLEKITNLFYTFNGMTCKVGINFIDQAEAEIFCNYFHIKQDNRQQKRKSKESTSISLTTNVNKIISTDKPLSRSDDIISKKQNTSKIQQQKKNKDNRPVISSPILSSFTHIIHAGSDNSFLTDDSQRELFEEVLSNMHITSEEKSYIRKTIIDTDGGLEELFTKLFQNKDNQRHEMADYPPKIPSDTYLTAGQKNNIKHEPHQDICIPSLINKGIETVGTQSLNTSKTSTIPERPKAPIIPPKPRPDIPNNTHSTVPTAPPLPPPRPVNLEKPKPISNIPPAPPLTSFPPEQILSKPFTPLPESQPNTFVQEIYDFDKSKLKPGVEQSTMLKTPSTPKSKDDIRDTLTGKILEMIALRRPAIMGCDNNDDENDSDDDEWLV